MIKSCVSIALLLCILLLEVHSEASFIKVDLGVYKYFYLCAGLFTYAFVAGLLSLISRLISGKFNYPSFLFLVTVATYSISAVSELQWILRCGNIYTPLPIAALLWFCANGLSIALILGKIGVSRLALRASLTVFFAGGLTALILLSPRANLAKGYTSYPKTTYYGGLIPAFISVGVDSDTFFSEKIMRLKKANQ